GETPDERSQPSSAAQHSGVGGRTLAEDDELDAEWEHPEVSEVKAVEAIEALEAEQAVDAIESLESEERAATQGRASSELDIDERHNVDLGDLDDEEHEEMVIGHDDNSGRVVEILKDTSSQTITMTVQEPIEPAIEPLVVADSERHPRAKRHTDTSD